MKAYRHADGSVWTFRPEENAARMVRSSRRLALPELPVGDFVAVRRRTGPRRRALGPGGGGGEEPLRPAVHVRLGEVPRGAPLAARHLHGDRIAGRGLLRQGPEAGEHLAQRGVLPRGRRRHGRGEDRRQLRQLAGRPAGGHRPRLRPGRLPRRGRAPLGRGARRDEPLLRPRRRHDRHPGAVRHDPRGDHPVLDHRAVPAAGLEGRGAQGSPSTSGATAWPPAGSPRSSPAVRRPW